ncbi:response regulator transcription factor [Streptococcus parauberis]|uniref:response regulator transcription factor n=1 Tax=Streptococcus parauberis TaxID=1348 RepID=UPI000E301C21|nr:response regulator transcription factor [Streptococcus parauberis]RFE01453.1 Sensory transduction protein regX3 [Streptococcus parauberis]
MEIKKRKILVLDDNVEILNLIKETLQIAGFKTIITASSQREAIVYCQKQSFHLAILDIMLPDGSGFDVLSEIRKSSDIPVIFLSAISDIEKQYQGFELGADDYIVKPFRPKDLELRILSILRRSYPDQPRCALLNGFQIDFEQAKIIKNDCELQLTAKEYKILNTLNENKNKIVTLDFLLEKVWGQSYLGYENTLMAHIRKIRQKIEVDPSEPVNLITVKGLGYQLRVKD